ncbi:PAS domain S-box-containing protein [Paucidesulfovibrio gracilis DSM 16080]|uniref:histidine kinase n=2 Tax=Paucidesulfovibrio TaxID=2910985 RepID=A0A1T4X4X6_9BACT|nr:PAS domain S-box-containing protein [Paucidesulfovibrio gracilis DSM 16080]
MVHLLSLIRHWPHRFLHLPFRLCIYTAISTILFLAISTARAHTSTMPTPAKVLVLLSYHQGYAWTDDQVRGILDVLGENGTNVDISFEYMDTKRFPPKESFPPLAAILQHRYSGQQPDLLLTCDDNALNFIKEYRDALFPAVPVVFCGINDLHMDRIAGIPRISGVAERFDMQATLETALRLHPTARQVVTVTDATPSNKANLEKLRKDYPIFQREGIRFLELHNLSPAQLTKRLSRLGDESVVFYLGYFLAPDGTTFTTRQGTRMVSRATDAPVYSFWDWSMGHGVVGGNMASGFNQGRCAANMARRVLTGESIDAIPVQWDCSSHWLFDARELTRFSIPPNRLPKGSEILFQKHSFLERNRPLALAIVGVFLLLTLATVALSMNILARRRAEQSLKESERRYRMLYEEATEGIFILDEDFCIQDVNPHLCRSLGFAPSQLRGVKLSSLMHKEDLALRPPQITELLMGNTMRLELRLQHKNGQWLFFEISARRLGPAFIQGICHDVTSRNATQVQLQRAKELAEAASRSKSTFLANMSHELRTPLTAAMGMLELLRAKDPRPDQLRHIRSALSACGTLTQLLGDILDISKVEAGRMELEQENFSLNKLINAVRLSHGPSARKRGLQLRIDLSPSLPDRLLGDPARIRQILINLVGNAIKYTEEGHVTLSVDHIGPTDSHTVHLLFTVTDTGIGMPDTLLPSIFDAFTQAEVGSNRKYQGSGLGLQIVKRLVQLMNGSLCMDTEPDRGTVAYLTLCLDRP